MRTRAIRCIGMLLVAVAAVAAGLAGCRHATPPVDDGARFDPNYAAWNSVLARYVFDDGVDYTALANRPEALEEAVASLRAVSAAEFEGWPRDRRLAYLVNAHNIHAIARVVRAWPITSIEETVRWGSALQARDIELLGRRWSLRELAAEVIGPRYSDIRVLFLLNWTEAGCAPHPPVAVTERNLQDLLERQVRRFLARPEFCRHDREARTIHLSPLLATHPEAIDAQFTTLWVFLERYLPADMSAAITREPPRIEWLTFDRTLNDASWQGPGDAQP